jgi:hypothetical protein
LAIYYEHRTRQPQQALEFTRQALAELHRAHRVGTIAAGRYHGWKARFERRLTRLERKLSLTLLGGLDFDGF